MRRHPPADYKPLDPVRGADVMLARTKGGEAMGRLVFRESISAEQLRDPLYAKWIALYDALRAWGMQKKGAWSDHITKGKLTSFIKWGARGGVVPELVTDEDFAAFVGQQQASVSWDEQRRRLQRLRDEWNAAACSVPGWPDIIIMPPLRQREVGAPTLSNGEIVSFGEHDFHPDLVAEIDEYCRRGGFLDPEREILRPMSHRDRLSFRVDKIAAALAGGDKINLQPRPLLPLRKVTLYEHRRFIYRAATALHLAGEAELANLRSIRDVIRPKTAALMVDAILKRLGREGESSYASIAVTMVGNIAARCGIRVSGPELAALKALLLDVLPPHGEQLPPHKLARIRAFDDPKLFAMLVAVPDVVMADLEKARRGGYPSEAEARQARSAIAVEILNTLPLRRRTLVSLEMERNFVRRSHAPPLLVVHPDQEKTRKRLEAALSERTWRLLQLYIRCYRPFLPGAAQSRFLFPSATPPGFRASIHFSQLITDFVRHWLGVHLTPHLWRHVMGIKIVERSEEIDHAEKLLGHVRGSKATHIYIGMGTRFAASWLREVTDNARPAGIELLRERRGGTSSVRRAHRPVR